MFRLLISLSSYRRKVALVLYLFVLDEHSFIALSADDDSTCADPRVPLIVSGARCGAAPRPAPGHSNEVVGVGSGIPSGGNDLPWHRTYVTLIGSRCWHGSTVIWR